MNHKELAEEIKKDCLILDIETYSKYSITKEFNNYVQDAKVKWIGFYSYKYDKYYDINAIKEGNQKIKDFINQHKTIISFNGISFDIPVLKNLKNNMFPDRRLLDVDCQVVLGSDIFHKHRGNLMGYKFRSNSLKNMATVMKLKTQKGDIDYEIFKKDEWNPDEEKEIKKYLRCDIEVTKQMFDKLFDFWLPFTEFVSEKNVKNWSWINSSIASLVYKSACYKMGWTEDYSDKGPKTDIGGRVIEPRVTEAEDIWYVDVTSLYPNIYIMFNLINEVSESCPNAWHINEVFKVKGYYNISEQHELTKDLLFKLKERIRLKKEDSSNPLVYAYKIYLNTFYGVNRSKVFKNLYTPNSGSDCCYLGQQINKIMEDKAKEMGYNIIAGDTDSVFIKHEDKKTKEEVKNDLQEIVDYILKYVPFPSPETFGIDIENYLHYIMYVPDPKTGKFKKKNYCYIYTDKKTNKKKVKIMGLPIKKVNATELGPLIFKKYIEPRMIEENKGKFEADWINNIIKEEVKNNIELMATEYKPADYDTYSFAGKRSLTAQISKEYLDGKSGIIKLIKNNKIGKVGGKFKYCTLEEAKEYGLKVNDLDLTKVFNELTPFTKGKLSNTKTGFFVNSSGNSVRMKLKAKGYF